MKIYAISDTHFNHDREKVHRPADFEARILKSVAAGHGDLLIHCGDFCIGNDLQEHARFLLAASNFKTKVFVRGNHDEKSDTWYYERGWDIVCYSFVLDHCGKRIIFTHMPIPYRDTEYWSPHYPPSINVHGHLHGNNHLANFKANDLYNHKYHYDLAPDIHNFKIVSLDSIVEKCGVLLSTLYYKQ